MSLGIFSTRNRLIAGLALLLVIVLLIIYSVIAFASRGKGGPQVGSRSPIETLMYCGADQDKLCIISFSQVVDGGMQINLQMPYGLYPPFVLKISHDGDESTYECERVQGTATAIVCTGASQVPGQLLKFTVISKDGGTIFAAGEFAIIGIALFTPAVEGTPTIEATLETPTGLLTVTPIPTPTLLATSYPSPSYPNPSYP
jgi:hypothetical protein